MPSISDSDIYKIPKTVWKESCKLKALCLGVVSIGFVTSFPNFKPLSSSAELLDSFVNSGGSL